MQETLKIKSETKKLREERERMNEELVQKKRELDQLKTRRKWECWLMKNSSKNKRSLTRKMLIFRDFYAFAYMKQQENMILNQLNQYKNLYLQASNENAHLKYVMSKHEDELEANRKTIESMDSRIHELAENQKEWDKEKAQLQSQRDCYKKELAKAKEEITKLQESKEAKELSE